MSKAALIVGAGGIVGGNLAERLLAQGWTVHGLARRPSFRQPDLKPIAADLTDAKATRAALDGLDVSHVFISAWSRQATEAENCRVNGAMVRNLLDGVGNAPSLSHVALVTGLKHYLGPFEAYGAGAVPETPFREEQGRQDVENFYYTQEDEVFAAAERRGFTWSVHRPHTIIGYALGNAMNMGVTLAVYANICRETGIPFAFPGSPTQWNALTDITDARCSPVTWNGRRPPKRAAMRTSTWSTATSSAGNGCGPGSRPISAWSLPPMAGRPSRWSGRWRMPHRSGNGSLSATG